MIKTVHGDCIDVMKSMASCSIDMVLCDLPYGTTRSKWDIVIPFIDLWDAYKRIVKPNGAIVLFGAEPFASELRLSNRGMYKYDWVWDKVKGTGFLNAKRQPMRNHETISVFYDYQCTYNPQKTSGHKRKAAFKGAHLQTDVYGKMNGGIVYDSTERYPRSIQVFSTDTQKSSIHPNQKPVKLLQFLIRTYTNEGGMILDNCAGSGSTGVASIEENRDCFLIEKDAGNYLKMVKRLNSKEVTNG